MKNTFNATLKVHDTRPGAVTQSVSIQMHSAETNKQEQLPIDITSAKLPVNQKSFACAIRVLFQNWRQGTVGCKTRGELAFSNKKPWRQKGTGRARVSSIRSPLWRKGGIIFGPQPRVRTLHFDSRQRAQVFNNLLHQALEAQTIHCLDMGQVLARPSAKTAASALRAMGLTGSKVVLFLQPYDALHFVSFRNLPYVKILFYDSPNAFDLANGESWVFLKQDVESFKNMVSKWN